MEEQITRLSTRPGEAGKVRKTKQALKRRMEPLLSSLMSWRAGGYLGFDRLPEELQQSSASVNAANGWTVGELAFDAGVVWECVMCMVPSSGSCSCYHCTAPHCTALHCTLVPRMWRHRLGQGRTIAYSFFCFFQMTSAVEPIPGRAKVALRLALERH